MNTKSIHLQKNELGDVRIQDADGNTIELNFNSDYDYRRKLAGPKTELLSKALGAHRLGQHVIDLTAGLGIDSISMVRLGYTVFAIERQALVYQLLRAAYNKWEAPEKTHLAFFHGQSVETIRSIMNHETINTAPDEDGHRIASSDSSQLKNLSQFTIGYFDPMFPRKKKSALPKQEVVVLQQITDEDPDSHSVFEDLRALHFFKRIVVKRPMDATPFARPTSTLKGKIIRYDIYDDHHRVS